MHIKSSGEVVMVEDGVVHLAFDLTGSDAGYLIIMKAGDRDQDPDEFFGADHYVEVKDQLYGRHGGLEMLTVPNEHAVVVRLSTDVPGVGREISIATAERLSGEMLQHLRQLERP